VLFPMIRDEGRIRQGTGWSSPQNTASEERG
jgi:hypothetical protein